MSQAAPSASHPTLHAAVTDKQFQELYIFFLTSLMRQVKRPPVEAPPLGIRGEEELLSPVQNPVQHGTFQGRKRSTNTGDQA